MNKNPPSINPNYWTKDDIESLAKAFAEFYKRTQEINRKYIENVTPLLKEPDVIDNNPLYTWNLPEEPKQ